MKLDKEEIKRLEEVLANEPSTDVCMALAMEYFLGDKKDKSEEYYRKALELQLKTVENLDVSEYNEFIKLGALYKHLKDDYNAKKVLRNVLEHLMSQPETTEIRLTLGNLHSLLDNEPAAIICYEKILKDEPENLKALENLLFIYDSYISKCRNLSKAKEIAKRILQIDPDNEVAKMDLERQDIDLDLDLGIDFLSHEKRIVIDSENETLTEDVIKFVKNKRWWAYAIFIGLICQIIYFATIILNK